MEKSKSCSSLNKLDDVSESCEQHSQNSKFCNPEKGSKQIGIKAANKKKIGTMKSSDVEEEETSPPAPTTSEDLDKLIRKSSGRAVPVPQLIVDPVFQELIDKLEPTHNFEDHISFINKPGSKRKLMKCKYCDASIRSLHHFRQHIKTHPQIDCKPFQCPFCDYTAQIRAQIARHINIHSNTKPYVCTQCGRGFNFKQKLQTHMKYHADVRDELCPMCSLSFHEYKTLKCHLKKVHNISNVRDFLGDKRSSYQRWKDDMVRETSAENQEGVDRNDMVAFVNNTVDFENTRDEDDQGSSNIKIEMIFPDSRNRSQDDGDNTGEEQMVADENGVFIINGVEYNPDIVLTIDESNAELLSSLDSGELVAMINETISSETLKNNVVKNNSEANCRSRLLISDSGGKLLESTENSSLQMPDSEEIIQDVSTFESVEEKNNFVSGVESNHKTKRKRGIYGARKTAIQTNKFMLSKLCLNLEVQDCTKPDKTAERLNSGSKVDTCRSAVKNEESLPIDQISVELPHHANSRHPVRPQFQSVENRDDSNSFICDKCDPSIVFETAQMLFLHLNEQHGSGEYLCKSCCHAFTEKVQLKNHTESVHSDEYPYKCDLCEKKFRLPKQLYNHMEVHSDLKNYKCHICSRFYKSQTSLHQHLKSHSCIYRCDICCRDFNSYSGFMAHRTMHNESQSGYKCDACSRVLFTKGSWMRHLKIVHSNIRTFKCKSCPKQFKTKKDLQGHLPVHVSEKSYICKTCNFGCKRAESLSVHMRRHLKVKPYQCGVCAKGYTQRHALENHIRKHETKLDIRHLVKMEPEHMTEESIETEDLYMCRECGSLFNTHDVLATHILKKHAKHHPAQTMAHSPPKHVNLSYKENDDLGCAFVPDAIHQLEMPSDDVSFQDGVDSIATSQPHVGESLVAINVPFTNKDKVVSLIVPRMH